jgi:Carboxypeptidase regulatory-like domain/TonB-dependent Receptor Plug Domain
MSGGYMRASLFGLLLLGAVSPCSLTSQTVQGSVHLEDSPAAVVGAQVILLDFSDAVISTVETDIDGRFVIFAPSHGLFQILVDRPGYINTLSEPFLLTRDGVVHLDFSVKREPVELLVGPDGLERALSSAIQERCGGSRRGLLPPALVGVVTDSLSGVSLPGVSVSLEWSERRDGLHLLQTWTSDQGIYAFCDPPSEGRPRLRAEAMGLTGDAVEVVTRVNGVVRLDLGLPLTESGTTGQVLGQVVDYSTGEPLATVEVRIRDADLWTLSDPRGFFRFSDVPPGAHVLEVDRVGYAHLERLFRVVGRAGHQVDVTLAKEAIVLDPITVEVRSRRWYADMAGLQDRVAAGLGYYLTRPDLVGRGITRLVDVVYGVPGFMVRRLGRYATLVIRGRECTPSVYLDGTRFAPDPTFGLDGIQVYDLEAVEFYRGPMETPFEFSAAPGCGAVVAWTRRGR